MSGAAAKRAFLFAALALLAAAPGDGLGATGSDRDRLDPGNLLY